MAHIERRCFRFVTLTAVICFIQSGVCFPNGAPPSTCMTMFPKHGIDQTWQSSGPCPFNITLSSTSYTPSQNITIKIEAEDKQPLSGLQISAHRKSANREEFVGEFVSTFPANKYAYYNCLGGYHNQISHKNGDKTVTTELVWQAPAENVGDIEFRATIVAEYRRFWALETADLLTSDPTTVIRPDPVIEEPTIGMTDIDFAGCGTDKGCFYYPKYCSGADCEAAMTYQKKGDLFTFEMMSQVPGFISLGLSDDTHMGQDFTVTCTASTKSGTVQNGLNPGYFNERLISYNLTQLQVKKTESHVMCRFTRPRILGTTRWKPNSDPPEIITASSDLDKNYYIMIASGEVCKDTGTMSEHTKTPIMSTSLVNFRSYDIYRGSSMSQSLQAHASLMAIAWTLFANLAGVIARHFKDLAPNKNICGSKVWFQVHRGLAGATILFTVIAFILVFARVQKLSTGPAQTHAIMGITVGVAVLLQVTAGMLRPGPDSQYRPIFKWGHRILGTATSMLAGGTIMFGFQAPFNPESMRKFGSIPVYLFIALNIPWNIAFEIIGCYRRKQGGKDFTDVSGMSIQEKTTPPSPNILPLILYIITLTVLTLAMVCVIILF